MASYDQIALKISLNDPSEPNKQYLVLVEHFMEQK